MVYADASVAKNDDYSTQLGHVVLLADDSGRASHVCFSSYKSQRVVRSVLGGELYALADAADLAFVLKRDLEAALAMEVPVVVLTDSFSLFNVLIRTSTGTT